MTRITKSAQEPYEVAAPYNEIYADVQRATTATITVGFGAAPTLSQYRVLVNRVF